MKQVSTYNLRLDFISWHHYTPNPDDYRIDTELLKNLMADYETYGRRVEVIISEWGPNSENDPSYDNSKSSAHLVSSLVEMMPVVDKAFVFELEDGKSPHNQEYWGRWGIYTHSDFGSHIKPRAEALKLLNRLGTDRIKVTGNGTWVKSLAARKGESIQLLVANYDQYSNHTENVPLTVDGLTPGTYRLSKTFISRSTYNQTIEINTSTHQTSIPMASNAVVLLELTRQ
jgi:hypothetical protein